MGDLRRRVATAVAGLAPGYFALVMASGIISAGALLQGRLLLSVLLLWICGLSYLVLVALTLFRLVRFRSHLEEDFTDPARGFGFFTFVAGTDVFAVRLAMDGHVVVATVLLTVAAIAWLVLGYVVPWTAVLGRAARPVLATANGTWFIWAVASQSVAVAASSLEPVIAWARSGLAVLAVLSWSVGAFLYASVGIFVALRLMLYPLTPKDLTPPYWVAMGAASITVLAGARIVEMAQAPMVDATRGLIAGVSVVFWAFATWLFPVLIAAGWWRHVHHRVPLTYDATLWSIIFPLGMYAVAGIYLGRSDSLPLVGAIGGAELWVALAAFLVTFVAMLIHLVRTVVMSPVPTAPHGNPPRS